MKNLLIILMALQTLNTFGFLRKDKLTDLKGDYQVVQGQSDHYCHWIKSMTIEIPSTNNILIKGDMKTPSMSGIRTLDEIKGINTRFQTKHTFLGVIHFYRHVYKNEELYRIKAEQSFIMPIRGRFKKDDMIIKVLDENTIEYYYRAMGTTTCTLERKL